MREAMYWEPFPGAKGRASAKAGPGNAVRCLLCPHACVIADGARGKCHARLNAGGTLYAETWGAVPALSLDPIEKKPFARFHPGSWILSAGSYGCNLSCLFCQNYGISQRGVDPFAHHDAARPATRHERDSRRVEPGDLVNEALALREEGNVGIAFTYNEPFVGYEYVWDAARLAKDAGLLVALVTNGYVNPEPLDRLLPYVDAMNVDVKAFTEGFYKELCGASLEPVLDTVRAAAGSCHVELTTLVIPGENSGVGEIARLAEWVASLNPGIPLHLNRHHPEYLMPNPPPIDRESLYRLADEARKFLSHVYVGNI